MKHYFVTGTGTDVGKTYISAIICKHFDFEYYKPIQTGASISKDVDFVSNFSKTTVYETYVYQEPVAPYVINKNKYISINAIKSCIKHTNSNLLVEGAGGVMTPIMNNYTMVDLMQDLNLPAILVAENKLGAMNAVFLSIECLLSKGVKVACVILNNITNVNLALENRQTISVFYPKIKIIEFNKEDDILFSEEFAKILETQQG